MYLSRYISIFCRYAKKVNEVNSNLGFLLKSVLEVVVFSSILSTDDEKFSKVNARIL